MSKTMHVQMVMPSALVPSVLTEWLTDALPFDITVKTGTRRNGMYKGQKMVCFTVYGTTQEDINDKLDALELLIDAHQLKEAITE